MLTGASSACRALESSTSQPPAANEDALYSVGELMSSNSSHKSCWRRQLWFPSVLRPLGRSFSSIFSVAFASRALRWCTACAVLSHYYHLRCRLEFHLTRDLSKRRYSSASQTAAGWRGSYYSSHQPPRWTGQRPDSRTPSATAARAYEGSARSPFIGRPTARPHHSRSPARRGH